MWSFQIDSGKAFDKINTHLWKKTCSKPVTEGNFLNLMKSMYKKPADHYWWNIEHFSPKPAKKLIRT